MASSYGSSPDAMSRPEVLALARVRVARRRLRRALLSLVAIGIVLLLGTIGFEMITSSGWVNSFYFESMLATGQGPPEPLLTNAGKLFASAMAFVSVGTVITTLLLNLGPLLGRIWREGLDLVEREVRRVEHELRGSSDGPG